MKGGHQFFFSFFASPPQVIKQSLFLFVLPTAEGLSLASWGLNGTGFLSFLALWAEGPSRVCPYFSRMMLDAGIPNIDFNPFFQSFF